MPYQRYDWSWQSIQQDFTGITESFEDLKQQNETKIKRIKMTNLAMICLKSNHKMAADGQNGGQVMEWHWSADLRFRPKTAVGCDAILGSVLRI